MVTSGTSRRSTRSSRSASRTSAGSLAADLSAAAEKMCGTPNLRTAISISMPGSSRSPSTSTMRPVGCLKRDGCSTSSTLTIWPALALPGEPATRMSWPMRLSSGAISHTPFSLSRRPMTWLLARETTSTMVPSRRPRRSVPVTFASTRSPCSTFCISLSDRNRSSPGSSGMTKPKPSRCALTLPATKPEWSASSNLPAWSEWIWPSRCIAFRRRDSTSTASGSTLRARARAAASSGDCASRKMPRISSRLGMV